MGTRLIETGATIKNNPWQPDDPAGELVKNPVSWNRDAKLAFKYTPHLARAYTNDGKDLTFRFIDTNSGKEKGGNHTVSLANWGLVHKDNASTVPLQADIDAGKYVCILMLCQEHMDANSAILTDSQGSDATGKWPKTAQGPNALAMRVIRGLVELVAPESLPPWLRIALHELGIGGS